MSEPFNRGFCEVLDPVAYKTLAMSESAIEVKKAGEPVGVRRVRTCALLEPSEHEPALPIRLNEDGIKRSLGFAPGDGFRLANRYTYTDISERKLLHELAKLAISIVLSSPANRVGPLPYSLRALHVRIVILLATSEDESWVTFSEVVSTLIENGGFEVLESRIRALGYVPSEGEFDSDRNGNLACIET